MQSTYIIWVTIFGYMSIAITVSLITSFWIRHNLRKSFVYPHCLLSDRPARYDYCLLSNRSVVYPYCLLTERPYK